MPYFDRFDICEAYYLLEAHYNKGGLLRERPSCRRRMESVGVQLWRMRFKPAPGLSIETLTENGRDIYDAALSRLGLPAEDYAQCPASSF